MTIFEKVGGKLTQNHPSSTPYYTAVSFHLFFEKIVKYSISAYYTTFSGYNTTNQFYPMISDFIAFFEYELCNSPKPNTSNDEN